MPEYEVDVHPDDSDSDVSAPSLDSEFGVPIMRTPGVKKVLTSTKGKLCCSSRAKNLVTWYAYNEYMAYHYAFTMKVAAEQEPERPSLWHMLEGEKRLNRGKEGRTTQSHEDAKAENLAKSRKPNYRARLQRKPKAAWMLTKSKKANSDVSRLTLELEGA